MLLLDEWAAISQEIKTTINDSKLFNNNNWGFFFFPQMKFSLGVG